MPQRLVRIVHIGETSQSLERRIWPGLGSASAHEKDGPLFWRLEHVPVGGRALVV